MLPPAPDTQFKTRLAWPGKSIVKSRRSIRAVRTAGHIRALERNKEFPFWMRDPLDPKGQDIYRKSAETHNRIASSAQHPCPRK